MTVRIRNASDKRATWTPRYEWEPGQTIDVEEHHIANQILSEKGFERVWEPEEQQRLMLARLHDGTRHAGPPQSDEISAEDKAKAREIARAKSHDDSDRDVNTADEGAVTAAERRAEERGHDHSSTDFNAGRVHHSDTTGGWQPEAADDQGSEQRLETAADEGTGTPTKGRNSRRK